MLFNGYVNFKGNAPFRWAKFLKDGSVEFIFDKKHNEAGVTFDKDAWAAVKTAVNELEAGHGTLGTGGDGYVVSNPNEDHDGLGSIEVSGLLLNDEEGPLRFESEKSGGVDFVDVLPTILVRTPSRVGKNDDVELILCPDSARNLRDLLSRLLRVHYAVLNLDRSEGQRATA